jgi:tRNA A-37 threonylcarbamoyl transferase component Bud32
VRTEREPAILADRYALQALLDRTAVGMVWLATDTVLDRRVTVTLVDPRVVDEAARDRLFAAARALATASPTHLVRLLDAGMDHDVPFLVTERVAGDTLADVLERDGPLAAGRAVVVVADVLDGADEAHDVGVLHLDLSPSNVIVDQDGRVRVRDPGIAEAALRGEASDGVAMPPEAPAVDARSDVWSAGVLLLASLTGAMPSDVTTDVVERVRAPRSVRAILGRALAADPGERFPDARAMASALRSASNALDVAAAPGGERPAVFRTWFAVPVIVAVVAAVVVAAGLWLGRFELGGPVGIRLHEEPSNAPAAAALPVAGIRVLDPPPGDGHENDDALPDAIDGDASTVWSSENYFDGVLNKAGIGIVLDLGGEATVTGFRLDTPAPGFSFSVLVGDDPQALLRRTEGTPSYRAPDTERGMEPAVGRFVLVWITSVVPTPDGANRAEISDIRIIGTA